MTTPELKSAYRQRDCVLRIIGGKTVRYRISSYSYLPLFPTVTVFCREAAEDVGARLKDLAEMAESMLEHVKNSP